MPEKVIETPYPLIDADPHASRVIRYMRPSDYAVWAGAVRGGRKGRPRFVAWAMYVIAGRFRGVVVHSNMPISRVRCARLPQHARRHSPVVAKPEPLPHSHIHWLAAHAAKWPRLSTSRTTTTAMFCECLAFQKHVGHTDMRCSLRAHLLCVSRHLCTIFPRAPVSIGNRCCASLLDVNCLSTLVYFSPQQVSIVYRHLHLMHWC